MWLWVTFYRIKGHNFTITPLQKTQTFALMIYLLIHLSLFVSKPGYLRESVKYSQRVPLSSSRCEDADAL